MKQKAYLGESSLLKLFDLLQKQAYKHIFLVRGKKSYALCGAKKIVDDWFSASDCHIVEFFDFDENPKYKDIQKGLTLLQSSKAEAIIAIGGGSVLDMAKLIRFSHSYSGDLTGSKFTKEKDLFPLYAVPTTAGTGCETTHFAVMYKNKVKYSVAHTDILPEVAIVYPSFTYSNTPYLTACTGFDALAQAIEAYWNVNATVESDKYALKAIELLWPNLPVVVNSPDKKSRDAVSAGSYWAGKAINITKTTAPHAMSYGFTSFYGLPHGHAVALSFPYFFTLNVSETSLVKENIDLRVYWLKIDRLKKILDSSNQLDIFIMLKKYINSIGLTNQALVGKIDKAEILSSINHDRIVNNPINITKDLLSNAFDSIFI